MKTWECCVTFAVWLVWNIEMTQFWVPATLNAVHWLPECSLGALGQGPRRLWGSPAASLRDAVLCLPLIHRNNWSKFWTSQLPVFCIYINPGLYTGWCWRVSTFNCLGTCHFICRYSHQGIISCLRMSNRHSLSVLCSCFLWFQLCEPSMGYFFQSHSTILWVWHHFHESQWGEIYILSQSPIQLEKKNSPRCQVSPYNTLTSQIICPEVLQKIVPVSPRRGARNCGAFTKQELTPGIFEHHEIWYHQGQSVSLVNNEWHSP